MHISAQEGSEYFRGLLLLIRKDRTITEGERALVMYSGRSLGFARSFCSEAIDDILDNTYISETPPVFTVREVAEAFITHGLLISYSDGTIHEKELQWLTTVAQCNGIDDAWVLREKEKIEQTNYAGDQFTDTPPVKTAG